MRHHLAPQGWHHNTIVQDFQQQDFIMVPEPCPDDTSSITKLVDDCLLTPSLRQVPDPERVPPEMTWAPCDQVQQMPCDQAQQGLSQASQMSWSPQPSQPFQKPQGMLPGLPQEVAQDSSVAPLPLETQGVLQELQEEAPQDTSLSRILTETQGVLQGLPQEVPQGTPLPHLPLNTLGVLELQKEAPQDTSRPHLFMETRVVFQGLQQEVPQGTSLPHLPVDAQGLFPREAPQGTPLPHQPLEASQLVPLSSPGVAGSSRASSSLSTSPPRATEGRKGRRSPHSRQPKLYERTEKFADPGKEKRRIDAINSKKNRDRKAAALAELRQKVLEFTRQRDVLLWEVEALKRRERELMQQLTVQPGLP